MTTRMIPARLVALTAVAALMLLFPASVAAHAELQETTPAAGATVEGTPDELVAVFDDPLLPDESSLSIRNGAGDRLAVGRVDPDEPTHLLISDVPELAPGPYEMRWTAATADGHIERGTWSFTVTVAAAATPAPTPEPSASAAASPAASPSATPEPSPSPEASPSASPGPSDPTGGSDGDVILPIIVALAIVLIAAALLLSRRGRPSGV